MKQKMIFLIATIGLLVYGFVVTVKVIKLQKSIKFTKSELIDAQNELQEANDKLETVSEKLSFQSSSADDIEDKVDNIQSYASELESSISNLLREIRWIDCDACQDVIWDIERKAKSVESDFQSLQSEIN